MRNGFRWFVLSAAAAALAFLWIYGIGVPPLLVATTWPISILGMVLAGAFGIVVFWLIAALIKVRR